MYELDKPCIVYRDDCLLYQKKGDEMPHSLRVRLKNLQRKGELTDKDIDRIFKALEQEPCDDAISRQAVIERLKKEDKILYTPTGLNYLIRAIEGLPSVTQKSETVTEFADRCRECGAKYGKLLKQEPKTGHWEWVQYDYNPKIGNWHCSECRCIAVECVGKNEKGGIPLYKYCPQCGAKMVEPQESEVRNERQTKDRARSVNTRIR